jgi:protein-disulfide isomerase
MLKIAIAAGVLAAAGTTAYVVHHEATQDRGAHVGTVAAQPAATPIERHARPVVRAAAMPALTANPTPASAPAPSDTKDEIVPVEAIERLKLTQGPSRGAANAPVTITVFQDNLCPYCGRALGTLDQLLDEYRGKLRIVVKQFVVHQRIMISAEACYAAEAQGKFWELHDLIFQHQDPKELTRDALLGYAKQIGLSVDIFAAALDQHTYLKQVKDDMASGKELDVTGTPTFVINGRVLQGALPIEDFRKAIDAALSSR